jgi:hypothetical protein
VKGYASPSPPAAENELQNRTVVTTSTKIVVGFFSLNRFQKIKNKDTHRTSFLKKAATTTTATTTTTTTNYFCCAQLMKLDCSVFLLVYVNKPSDYTMYGNTP